MIRWLEKNKGFSIIFVIIIAVEIFLISSIPGKKPIISGVDLATIYHAMVFFLFNFFLLVSINGNKKISVKFLLIAIIISIFYAILDEMHQFFVPLRNSSINDILIDNIGIFLSTLAYLYYSKRKN
jgi:hypothetical protein